MIRSDNFIRSNREEFNIAFAIWKNEKLFRILSEPILFSPTINSNKYEM